MAQRRQSQDQIQAMETAIKETVQKFQHELNGMLTQVTNTMEDLKKASVVNGNQLKAEYVKGYADVQAQMSKATTDMIAAYTKNYNELKASLKENYDNLYGQAKSSIDSNLQRFKQTVPPVLANIPGPQQKVFQDIIKGLDDNSAKTLKSLENSYKDMIATLDKTYQEGLKSLQQGQPSSGPTGSQNAAAGSTNAKAAPPKKK